jgi:hypothetical protein
MPTHPSPQDRVKLRTHWLFLLALPIAVAIAACTGETGATGAEGPQGSPGLPGEAGPPGPAGEAGVTIVADASLEGGSVDTTCFGACHGFGNVVDQWKFSKHYLESNLAGDEPAWTAGGPCGNCHAIDGLERRVAGTVDVATGATIPTDVSKGHMSYQVGGTGPVLEIGYSGPGRVAIIHCTTCHQFDSTNDPHVTGKYVPGSAPLRVASGIDDYSVLEKSPAGSTSSVGQPAGKWKAGNTCIMCHKSRKDVTFYITSSNKLSSAFWGPHEGPQADIYTGAGGYHFAGMVYGSAVHTVVANGCQGCHMQPVKSNHDVPDHSMHPSLELCKTCHTTYTGTDFDVQGGQTTVKAALKELQAALNAKNLLTRSAAAPYVALSAAELGDGNYDLDRVRPGSAADGSDQVVDAATAGAIYNYLLIARGRDFGVHNPTYTKQLLFDSIKVIKGTTSTVLPVRPS